MLFVNNDETNLVTQGTEGNACADNEMRSRLKESVVCIEPLTSTQARMDRLGFATSSSEHVRSDCHLRRLWHQPEHRASSGDHPHRSIGRCATLARARWPINEQRLPRRTGIAGSVGDLALHVRQADLGPCRVNRCTPPIGMSALNASHLKLNGASIGESSRRCKATREHTCSHPRVIAARRYRELLHCGNLSATETHRLQDRRGSIRDQRSEGRIEALRTATDQ
jgi:hypothetical protein